MFHGSAPNSSSSCRMAQFLKAFPRSKSFPVTDHYGNVSVGVGVDVDASNVSVAEEGSSAAVSAGAGVKDESSRRLVRRALALRREMQAAGSLDCVSPLGHTLFGFDALDP